MELSVRELLHRRQETSSIRGHRADPHHLALVIEGGGMRGVVSGGMISALEERGLTDCFDSIHGSSAGACAGAYFLAKQARLGTRIYYEDVNNTSFINLWRPLIGRPIMSTYFLIDYVMRKPKPLDVGKVLSDDGVLHVVTTSTLTGKERIYNHFRDAEHFFSVLRASITIPIIGGGSVSVDGDSLVDGGIVQQVAVRSAIESGASHILVLMTRRSGELERLVGTIRLATESFGLQLMQGTEIAAAYRRRNPGINDMLEFIKNPPPPLKIESIVRPTESLEIDRLTTTTSLLMDADKEAQQAVFSYLDAH